MKYFLAIAALIILWIYHPWLDLTKTLSSGDWPYLFFQNIQVFKIPTEPPFLWLEPYYQITAKLGVQLFSLSWEITEKIFWFFPFLIISFISSYSFLKYLGKNLGIVKNLQVFAITGTLIFTTNTYILMMVGGGQLGVAMAYSLMPLILKIVFTIIDNSKFNLKKIILSSVILGIQLMFDPRVFVLSVLIVFLYILFRLKNFNLQSLKKVLSVLVLATVINLFWILPNLNYFNTEYKSAIDAVNADYLSFATFSNSISLLHPNWPENIFGKIGFMKSEFIVLPILVFLTLFYVSKNKNKEIIFFAFLGLFGAFFAKGTNPPFGELYRWLSNFPGFSIFRDPTKFYALIVISYMVLIPYSLCKLSEKISGVKNKSLYVFVFAFLVYWLFLIRPAVFGSLTGTFKPHVVPQEYINFKDFINKRTELSKTLWIPSVERFGFNSTLQPAISAVDLFGVSSVSGVLNQFDIPETKKQLADEEIKYVIVPYDYLKEIFLTERQYDNNLYTDSVNKLRNIYWLSEIKDNNFGQIKVFKVSN